MISEMLHIIHSHSHLMRKWNIIHTKFHGVSLTIPRTHRTSNIFEWVHEVVHVCVCAFGAKSKQTVDLPGLGFVCRRSPLLPDIMQIFIWNSVCEPERTDGRTHADTHTYERTHTLGHRIHHRGGVSNRGGPKSGGCSEPCKGLPVIYLLCVYA